MKIISFAWTTPALLAGVKTVTRRDWSARYAAQFGKGDIVQAYDRQPRYGGKKVALIRLTHDPSLESTAEAPLSDFELEGFRWLEEWSLKVDGLSPVTLWRVWGLYPRELWVVRFEVIEICPA